VFCFKLIQGYENHAGFPFKLPTTVRFRVTSPEEDHETRGKGKKKPTKEHNKNKNRDLQISSDLLFKMNILGGSSPLMQKLQC